MKNQHFITIIVSSIASLFEIAKVINQIEDLVEGWFNPFVIYLSIGALPKGKRKAYAIVSKLRTYFIEENKFYRKTPLGPRLLCATKESNQNLLKEEHIGQYESHSDSIKLI